MTIQKLFRAISQNHKIIKRSYSTPKNPFRRTWNIISSELPNVINKKNPTLCPEHCDIVIIGGGFLGSAIAYWLKVKAGDGVSVVVLDKDLSFKNAHKCSYIGGQINQHFSLPENVHLSQYSVDFLRNSKEHLGSHIDVQFRPTPNLVLACEQYAERLEYNVSLQKELGVRNKLLMPEDIKLMYPWINVDDVKLGCISMESDGHFNSWALLNGLVEKSNEMGAKYVQAEVTGFELDNQRDVLMEGLEPGKFKRMVKVQYKTPDGEKNSIKFALCILTAGYNSKNIAELAQIGVGSGLLSVPIPVEKRDQHVYSVENVGKSKCLDMPLITDTSGVWCKRNVFANDLICGQIPLLKEEGKDLPTDEYYEKFIKPFLTNRIPSATSAEIRHIATETYDFNTYDETGILGPHPYHCNLFIATGFGKYGCSHAPGLGRALSELIINGNFVTTDLTRYGFDRLLTTDPMMEFNVY